MSTLVSALQDAAASREAWPDALKALTEAAGVAGAALIISNKSTGNVEEACFFGLSAEFKSDYIRHYAALDPYSPLLDGSWKKLSECFSDPVLRRSEWYNDFVLACGVRDILGARLVETPVYHVIFGIHLQIGRSFPARLDSLIELVTDLLQFGKAHHGTWRKAVTRDCALNSAIQNRDGSFTRWSRRQSISSWQSHAPDRRKRFARPPATLPTS